MILFVFLIGVCCGSFINVLENRLYKNEDVLAKSSHCDFCGKRLKWIDLIPVLSWIIYRRRSRCCGNQLSWQYPIIELITGIGFVAIFLYDFIVSLIYCFIAHGGSVSCDISTLSAIERLNIITILQFVIFIFALAIFLQDFKYQAIHEKLLQLIIVTTLVYNFYFFIFNEFPKFQTISFLEILKSNFIQNLFSAVLYSLPFYFLFKISKEKWLGEGDMWIVFWMGLLLGWHKGILGLYFGILTGGIVSMVIVLLHLKKMRDTISLGPFLMIGVVMSLLWFEVWRLT